MSDKPALRASMAQDVAPEVERRFRQLIAQNQARERAEAKAPARKPSQAEVVTAALHVMHSPQHAEPDPVPAAVQKEAGRMLAKTETWARRLHAKRDGTAAAKRAERNARRRAQKLAKRAAERSQPNVQVTFGSDAYEVSGLQVTGWMAKQRNKTMTSIEKKVAARDARLAATAQRKAARKADKLARRVPAEARRIPAEVRQHARVVA